MHVLLFSTQLSFLLRTTLGLFLLFPFAFIFISHVGSSAIENDCSSYSPVPLQDRIERVLAAKLSAF